MFQRGLAVRRCLVWAIALVAAACSSGQAYGQYTWSNPAGGNWGVSTNWVEGTPAPGPTTALTFGTVGTQTSTYTATNNFGPAALPFDLNSLTLNNTSGTVTLAALAGRALNFTTATSSINIAGAGNLTISSPITFAPSSLVTLAGSGSGAVTISGLITGSTNNFIKTTSGTLTLSGGGTLRQLSLQNGSTFITGGTLALTQPTGALGADANGLSGLQIGSAAGQTASFTLSGGATLNVTENIYVGDAAGSTGTLTVTGAGTVLNALGGTSNRLGVGNNGSGTLNVLNGAVVNVRRLFTPRFPTATSTILVDGANSVLHVTLQASVMSQGSGSVTIQNGGRFQADATFNMGNSATGTGTFLVTGAGSTASVVSLQMGAAASPNPGPFNLNVQAGGAYVGTGSISLAPNVSTVANIAVTGTGSTLNLTGTALFLLGGTGAGGTPGGTASLSAGSGGTITSAAGASVFAGGTINLNAGGFLSIGNLANGNATSFGAVNVASGTTLNLTGASDATFTGLIAGAGAIAKSGAGVQTLAGVNTFSGGTTITGGTLAISNSSALGTGSVAIGSGATLNGTLAPVIMPAGTTLSGAGTALADVTIGPGATIRGGASGTTDTLTVTGNLSAVAAAGSAQRTQITVSPTAETTSLIQVNGTVNFVSDGSAPFVFDIQSAGITQDTSYTRTVATATGGFQINGTPLPAGTPFTLNSDYILTSSDFYAFEGVSLSVDPDNNQRLILTFTPVPEPGTVLGIAAAGAFLFRMRRRIQSPLTK